MVILPHLTDGKSGGNRVEGKQVERSLTGAMPSENLSMSPRHIASMQPSGPCNRRQREAWARDGMARSCKPEDPRPVARLQIGRGGQAKSPSSLYQLSGSSARHISSNAALRPANPVKPIKAPMWAR